jgi:CHAT domain-containing protein/uncharacterized protein HemY
MQKGIDVMVHVYAPDGKKLLDQDSRNGTEGPEPVSLVAETTGGYRIEIRSFRKDAVPGRYEARVEEVRAATAQDKSRCAAQMKEAEATLFQVLGTKESLRVSIDKHMDALLKWRAAGDRAGEAAALSSIGEVYYDLGEPKKALDYLNQALLLQRAVGDRSGEATTLNGIGNVYSDVGEKQKALDYYNQALPLLRAVGYRLKEATTMNNLGEIYNYLGDNQKALDYYNESLTRHRSVGYLPGEAETLNSIGSVYSALGENQKALDYYNRALLLQRLSGARSGGATALNGIGNVYRYVGEKQKALDYYNQALELLRAVGGRQGEATVLNNIGAVYSDLGEKQKALDYYDQALRIRRQVSDRLGEATALHCASEAERDLGRLAAAKADIDTAIDVIESVRAKLAGNDLRSSFVNSVQSYYTLSVDVLMQTHKKQPSEGFDAAALKASERGRARSLLDLLVESHSDIRLGVEIDLLERERALQTQLATLSSRHIQLYGKDGAEDEQKALSKQIDRLNGEYQEVEAAIRSKSPRYAALTQPEPLDLKQIQQRVLDSNTVLLEYSIGAERSYMWVVAPHSIATYELPGGAILEPLARLYAERTAHGGQDQSGRSARPVTEDPDYRANALRLSAMLLGPAAGSLGKQRLLIVADGALEYVPFAALPDPAAPENEDPEGELVPLIVRHEVVNAPSASTIDVMRTELAGRTPAPKAVALLADPVFSSNDPRVKGSGKIGEKAMVTGAPAPSLQRNLFDRAAKDAQDLGLTRGGVFERLPGTRAEADKIASLAGGKQCKVATDFQASKITAASADLSQYRYVHFATHGLIDARHPELTGVVLSMVDGNGNPADGFLAAREVYNLKLPADMVVLSACQTALGKQIRGEGLVGLTRGFMYAGAPRVIASLWKVDDAATAELMAKLYSGILKEGKRPAEALRAAQLEMWKQKKYQAAYYWAAFELQGEWR